MDGNEQSAAAADADRAEPDYQPDTQSRRDESRRILREWPHAQRARPWIRRPQRQNQKAQTGGGKKD